MKPCIKIISAITLACFSLTNISFAQEINTFKLSPPSSFSSMKGGEFKEAAQIQAGVLAAIKGLQGLDIASIKALGQRQFIEKSVFGKRIEGDLYFNEVSECRIEGKSLYTEKGNYIFKATTNSGKRYYVLLSIKDNNTGRDISVVSETVLEEALTKGIVKFTHESVAKKDKDVIGRYLEHEITTDNNIAIDEWIRIRMERGEYAADSAFAHSDLYKHIAKGAFNRQNYRGIINNISKYLKTLGVKEDNIAKIGKAMLFKPLILIPYENESDLPVITAASGEKVRVRAHSSQFATYVFIAAHYYDKAVSSLGKWDDRDLVTYIEDRIVHEMGAICGLKAKIINGRFWNILDEYYFELSKEFPIEKLLTVPQSLTDSIAEELRDISPVNLFELELRNDYAAGETEKKSIFKRVLTIVLACSVAVGGYIYSRKTAEETRKVQNTSSEDYPIPQYKPKKMSASTSPDIATSLPVSEEDIALASAKAALVENTKTLMHEMSDPAFVSPSQLSMMKNRRELVEPLLEILIYGPEELRPPAAICLGAIGDRTAIDPLARVLKLSGKLGAAASRALGMLGDEKTVTPMIEALRVEKEYPMEIIEGLINIGPAALGPLEVELKDRRTSHREAIREAIKTIKLRDIFHKTILGNPQAKAELDKQITEDWIFVRSAITDALLSERELVRRNAMNELAFALPIEKKAEVFDQMNKNDHHRTGKYAKIDYFDSLIFYFNSDMGYAKDFITTFLQAAKNSKDPRICLHVMKKVMMTGISKEYLSVLTRDLDRADRDLLDILYQTSPSYRGETAADVSYMDAVKRHTIEESISRLFDDQDTINSLIKLEQYDPETVKKFVSLIVSYGGPSEDYTWVSADANELNEAMRFNMLARRSVVVKLLAADGWFNAIAGRPAYFKWSSALNNEISFPIIFWTKNDRPSLERLLNSPHEYYRNAAKKALSLVEKIASEEKAAVAELLGKLGSKDFGERYKSLYLLSLKETLPEECIALLVMALNENNFWIRQLVISNLIKTGEGAIGPISEFFGSDIRDDIRISLAIEIASKIGGPQAVKFLMQVLNYPDNGSWMPAYAGNALIGLKDPAIVNSLAGYLKDKVHKSLFEVVLALGETGDKRAAEVILSLMKVIVDSDGTGYNDRLGNARDLYFASGIALGKLKTDGAVKPLLALLYARQARGAHNIVDAVYIEEAARLLGELKDKGSVEELIKLALSNKDDDQKYIPSAVSALGKIGGPKVAEALIELLGRGGFDIRLAAVRALGALKDPSALKSLNEILEDKDDALPKPQVKEAINKIQEAPKGDSMREEKQATPQYIQDKITEILWQAAIGSRSESKVKEELAQLVPEAGATPEDRDRVYASWIRTAESTTLAMSVKRALKHNPPDNESIRQIADRIKESGVEVFIPKSQFPEDTTKKYRAVIESIGGKLRVYQSAEDLENMVTDPGKSIVMTINPSFKDIKDFESLKTANGSLRIMRFAQMEDLEGMNADELDNYQADILSILLVARIITSEDLKDKGNSTYRLLAHLLEDYMPEGVMVEDYLQDMVTNAVKLITTILKALPAEAYKAMRQSVEVLWAA